MSLRDAPIPTDMLLTALFNLSASDTTTLTERAPLGSPTTPSFPQDSDATTSSRDSPTLCEAMAQIVKYQ